MYYKYMYIKKENNIIFNVFHIHYFKNKLSP